MAEINARIERRRAERGVTVKALCDAIGIEHYDYSRKIRLKGSSWTILEISRIADHLDAPTGWPFLTDELAEMVDRALGRKKGE